MATTLKMNACIYMCVWLLLISCLNETADCSNSTSGHGWRIADDEAELVSEISRRILAGKRVISYDSMKQNKEYCDANAYSSCIGSPNKFYNNRPCDYKNLCDRNA
ncbi:hypothetical protein Salat_2170200 [Sesamum alatum]|uniref:Rapid ALkalinization Factor n=1 Tax=Sesamum alatum TaxID=300844 RepID=A0AAE2CD14_9LAMI|nr:hypothetical protein Salat_2170200 [Sesamum alatum]